MLSSVFVLIPFAPIVGGLEKVQYAGLEAAFQVPMPGDSGLSPDASSISNYCLTATSATNPGLIEWK